MYAARQTFLIVNFYTFLYFMNLLVPSHFHLCYCFYWYTLLQRLIKTLSKPMMWIILKCWQINKISTLWKKEFYFFMCYCFQSLHQSSSPWLKTSFIFYRRVGVTHMLQLNPLISLISTCVNDRENLDWINTCSLLHLHLAVPSRKSFIVCFNPLCSSFVQFNFRSCILIFSLSLVYRLYSIILL